MTTLQHIRRPLRDEMHQAFDTAMDETEPTRSAFYSGLGIGYAVAFGLVTRESLDRARLDPYARNVHIDFWRPTFGADEDSHWATGVLHGYYLGTSERSDVSECDLCGQRITPEDDTDNCEHGTFCAGGCIRDWHVGGGLDQCTFSDGE